MPLALGLQEKLWEVRMEANIQSWRELSTGKINICELLRSDHEEILSVCDGILGHEDLLSREAHEMFLDLKKIIVAHTKAEEMIFYNALHDMSIENQDDDLRFDVVESFEEHHLMELLLRELTVLDMGSVRWKGKMKLLRETLRRHIEREEVELFREVGMGLEEASGRSLAMEFLEEKEEWMEGVH